MRVWKCLSVLGLLLSLTWPAYAGTELNKPTNNKQFNTEADFIKDAFGAADFAAFSNLTTGAVAASFPAGGDHQNRFNTLKAAFTANANNLTIQSGITDAEKEMGADVTFKNDAAIQFQFYPKVVVRGKAGAADQDFAISMIRWGAAAPFNYAIFDLWASLPIATSGTNKLTGKTNTKEAIANALVGGLNGTSGADAEYMKAAIMDWFANAKAHADSKMVFTNGYNGVDAANRGKVRLDGMVNISAELTVPGTTADKWWRNPQATGSWLAYLKSFQIDYMTRMEGMADFGTATNQVVVGEFEAGKYSVLNLAKMDAPGKMNVGEIVVDAKGGGNSITYPSDSQGFPVRYQDDVYEFAKLVHTAVRSGQFEQLESLHFSTNTKVLAASKLAFNDQRGKVTKDWTNPNFNIKEKVDLTGANYGTSMITGTTDIKKWLPFDKNGPVTVAGGKTVFVTGKDQSEVIVNFIIPLVNNPGANQINVTAVFLSGKMYIYSFSDPAKVTFNPATDVDSQGANTVRSLTTAPANLVSSGGVINVPPVARVQGYYDKDGREGDDPAVAGTMGNAYRPISSNVNGYHLYGHHDYNQLGQILLKHILLAGSQSANDADYQNYIVRTAPVMVGNRTVLQDEKQIRDLFLHNVNFPTTGNAGYPSARLQAAASQMRIAFENFINYYEHKGSKLSHVLYYEDRENQTRVIDFTKAMGTDRLVDYYSFDTNGLSITLDFLGVTLCAEGYIEQDWETGSNNPCGANLMTYHKYDLDNQEYFGARIHFQYNILSGVAGRERTYDRGYIPVRIAKINGRYYISEILSDGKVSRGNQEFVQSDIYSDSLRTLAEVTRPFYVHPADYIRPAYGVMAGGDGTQFVNYYDVINDNRNRPLTESQQAFRFPKKAQRLYDYFNFYSSPYSGRFNTPDGKPAAQK